MMEEHQAKPTAAETAAEGSHDEHFSDTVVLLGRKFTVYGGIYTVVFVALGILTLIEVALGTISTNWTIPWLRVILLMAIAGTKAALVVLFYMHLKSDSRLFALTLLVPLGVALVSVLYLLAVPVGY